jgi:hypothetical protein
MSPVLASYRPIEFRDENNATAHTLRQKTDMEQLSDDEELTLLTRIRRFYGHSLLWTHDCMVSGVNPIALSVFAVDPGIVTGNSLPAESGADPSMSLFAELLQQAAPMIEDPDAAPAAGADGIPKTAARDSSLVLDAIAAPEHTEEKPEDDSVAIAYALVANMPVVPLSEPAPARIDAGDKTPRVDARTSTVADLSEPAQFVLPTRKTVAEDVDPNAIVVEAKAAQIVVSATEHIKLPVDSSKPDQPAPISSGQAPPTGEPLLTEATQTRSDVAAAPPETPQPVILEARITKQGSAPESGKPAMPKENSSTEAPPSERQSDLPIAMPVKAAAKAEFSTGEHTSEHKDERQVRSVERQPAVHHEPFTTPIASVESERSTTLRNLPQEGASRVFSPPEIPEPAKADPAPLKSMDLKIPDANGGNVTVRLQERAGAVHVSVRSNDTQLANGVAANLPELSRNLDGQGFHAETWTPADAQRVIETGPEGHLRAAHEHTMDASSAHGETMAPMQPDLAQSGNESSDNHRKPDWQEEMYKRPRRPSDENFKEYLS